MSSAWIVPRAGSRGRRHHPGGRSVPFWFRAASPTTMLRVVEERRENGDFSGVRNEFVPALDLDELLTQLIDRAQDVRRSHDRLRGLLHANQSITSNLALEVVLQRIAEAACELLDAKYGALGVLAPDGHGLEQFIHVGIDQQTVDRIGDLPQGKGVLGALIEDPVPIRLHDLSDDLR